ncbi:MAG: WD40 repeat domain-containing protein, partial [Phycisphaerae bacterium]
PDVGEPWKTCVPLAAEDPKSLAPAACRELGDWYRGLAEEAAPPGRRAMLLRAEAHYEIFLSKAPPDHAARGAVGPALAKVRQDLGLRSAPAQAPAGQSAGRLTGALSLVADPAKIQGVRSWTLETRRPRGRILALAYSPDAKHIAVAGECGTVRLLSAESGKLVRAFAGHENEVRDLAFLPNGTTLASASADKTIRFWDVGTGCCVRALSVRAGINAVAISPDGKTVATATDEKAVAIWNIETGRAGGLLQGGHQAGIEAMAWSPDGKWVASGGGQGDGTACVWDAITKRRLHAIQPGFNAIGALAWSPDGQVLAIGDGQKKGKGAALWDVRSRKIVRSLGEGFARKTVALAWSPDGKKLAMRGQECVQAWRAHTGQAAEKFQVGWELSGLAWSPDGSKLAACDPDRRIALWQAGDGKRLWSIRVQHTGGARAIAWRPGQKRVAVWPDPGNLSIWDLTTAERTSEAVVGEGRALRWSPNGKLLAYDQIKQIVLLDGESGKRLRSFGYTECESGIQAFQWSPDSRRLALTAHYGADPMVFDVSSGRMLRQLKGYASGACIDLDWSPNGKMVALGALGEAGLAKNVAIWQADTGRHLGVLVAPGPKEARPTCIAWAPDNMRIVAGATDGVVLVWDLRKGRKVRRLADGEDRISAVSWSPSGAIVAAAEEPRRGGSPIRLWDGRTAREKGVLRGHVAGVRWLAWSRDSRTLLSACNRVVRFWDIQAMRPRLTFLRLQGLRAVVIGAGGHFRATASLDVEASLVYVVQTDKGQDTLSPSAFAQRHGWKNDPTKVRP